MKSKTELSVKEQIAALSARVAELERPKDVRPADTVIGVLDALAGKQPLGDYTPFKVKLGDDTAPAATKLEYGEIRITWSGDRWRIEKWRWFWQEIVAARTLWGIKRQWRKLFGESKPFPDINLVVS